MKLSPMQVSDSKTYLMSEGSHPLNQTTLPSPPGLHIHPPQTMRQTRCVVQALVVFIKNNFGSKNSTLDSVILSIKKTIIQEQIQKILNYENKSIKAPFIYIMYTQTGRDSQSRRIKSTVIA